MPIQLSEPDRRLLKRMVTRPRSLKKFYVAKALLEIDRGREAEAVSRKLRIPLERVTDWIALFEDRGMAIFGESEPRPRTDVEAPMEFSPDELQERKEIEDSSPRKDILRQLAARFPAPAEWYREEGSE